MDAVRNSKYKKIGNKLELLLLGMTILFSISSQVDDAQIIALTRPLMYGSWLLIGSLLIVRLRFSIKLKSFGFFLLIGYASFWFVSLNATLFGIDHLHAGLITPLTVSVGSYFLGVLLHQSKLSHNSLNKVLVMYAICVLLLALQIKSTYFGSLSTWMSQMTYGYGRKNSAGQILGLASLIFLFYLTNKNKVYLLLRLAAAAFLLYVLLLVQSRAALIAFTVACFTKLLFQKKGRIIQLFGLIIIGVILLTNETFSNIISKALFIDKYAGTNLNTFSSGRLGLWQDALNKFQLHPFVGTGGYYVDNFYINVLTEQGLFGALIIFSLVFTRFFLNFRIKINDQLSRREENLYVLIKLFSVFYIVESFLEGFPPLGPGVCAFLFWMLCGYIDMSYNKKKNKTISNSERIENTVAKKTKKKRIRITW